MGTKAAVTDSGKTVSSPRLFEEPTHPVGKEEQPELRTLGRSSALSRLVLVFTEWVVFLLRWTKNNPEAVSSHVQP